MKQRSFLDYDKLAKAVLDYIDDGKTVYAALFYYGAKELLRSLLLYSDVDLVDIELESYDCNFYDKEFYVIVDPSGKVYVEKAWYDSYEGYAGYDSDITLIDADANKDILSHQEVGNCIEIRVSTDVQNKY